MNDKIASETSDVTVSKIHVPWSAGEEDSEPLALLRLDGSHVTLLLIRRAEGLPEIAYWGRRLPSKLDVNEVYAIRSPSLVDNGPDQWLPLITVASLIGGMNFDIPGIATSRPDGSSWANGFSVQKATVSQSAIEIEAIDKISAINLQIFLKMDVNDVLSMQTFLTNVGTSPLNVTALASGTFLLPATIREVQILQGAWTQEFQIRSMTLSQGAIVIENRRNRSCNHFPALLAGLPGVEGDHGDVWGFQLAWSGNHKISAERMEDGRIRVLIGEFLYPGEAVLAPGQIMKTPVAYATFSDAGFGGIARAFQAHARSSVLRWPGGQMKPRPVLLNSWEGNRFDLNEEQLFRQVEAAARLGIERFVLDDGWFGSRRNPTKGLGDWWPAPSIFPKGLRPLSDYVHELGMEFGLWFEPEMINPDSDLYRAHPDWVLSVAGRPLWTSRNQLVLDISRQEVIDYLFTAIAKQIEEARVDYIKWDFNCDLVDAGDMHDRAAYRAQIPALYALWDRLSTSFPQLEIETCASGAGRADWGALAYTQRIWASDNTDALDRLTIQTGAWHFLPPEITGCHISAVPNWHSGRITSLDFRAAVAIFGHLGIEFDPLHLDPQEAKRLSEWIALHKRLRPILHHGLVQFGENGATRLVHGVTAPDGAVGIFLVAQRDRDESRRPPPVFLPGLDPQRNYRITVPAPQMLQGFRPSNTQKKLMSDGIVASGALLREAGLFLPEMKPQTALLLECWAI